MSYSNSTMRKSIEPSKISENNKNKRRDSPIAWEKIFQHMINFIHLLCRKDGRIEPNKYLNIEISTDQIQILNLSEKDLRRSKYFQDVMQKSNRKLATRKINVIGNMVGHFSVLTSEKY